MPRTQVPSTSLQAFQFYFSWWYNDRKSCENWQMVNIKISVIPVSIQGLVGWWGFGLSDLVEGVLDYGKGLEQDHL